MIVDDRSQKNQKNKKIRRTDGNYLNKYQK